MRRLFLVLATLGLVGCASEKVSVYNGCAGSYLRLSDGSGHVLVSRLEYGGRAALELHGASGEYNQILVNADGFRVSDNRPLGATSRTFSQSGSGITAPESAWNIEWLPGGCAPYWRDK